LVRSVLIAGIGSSSTWNVIILTIQTLQFSFTVSQASMGFEWWKKLQDTLFLYTSKIFHKFTKPQHLHAGNRNVVSQ
jgi:hypothetical protein